MTTQPAAARDLRAVLRDLVRAAGRDDPAGLAEGAARLDRVEPEHVRLVLGHIVRGLVERTHPDGVDADDLSDLLQDVVRASAWYPELDATALVVVLTGAFGVHPDEPVPAAPAAREVALAAAVLVAHLLRGRDPGPLLDAALAEVARAETMEMP
ncbi:hypothetical protein GCM10028777_29180 [Angustibacter speluncae]